jgi:hypothetical protein
MNASDSLHLAAALAACSDEVQRTLTLVCELTRGPVDVHETPDRWRRLSEAELLAYATGAVLEYARRARARRRGH